MPLHRHIATLRSKPEHIRKHIAFWSALGVTAVIFAFWIASFSTAGFSFKPTVSSAVEKAGSPASSLAAAVGGFFVDIKDLIFGAKKVTYTSGVEISPGK